MIKSGSMIWKKKTLKKLNSVNKLEKTVFGRQSFSKAIQLEELLSFYIYRTCYDTLGNIFLEI